MDEKDLLKLKKEIDTAKAEIQTLTGEKNYLMKELNDTWQCKSVKDAEALIKKMEVEVANMKTTLEKLLQKIKERYDAVGA